MNFSTTQIEAITQGVLQQLRSRGVVVSRGTGNNPVPSLPADAGLPVGDKVITEDSLAAIGAAGKTVRIASSGWLLTTSTLPRKDMQIARRHEMTLSG